MDQELENKEKFKRKNNIIFRFNDHELLAFERYCKKYKVENKSKFIRETVITAILQRFDLDYPSLFENLEDEKTGHLF
jgi:hypothetical protein